MTDPAPRPPTTGPVGAVDVHYRPDGSATAALVVGRDRSFAQVVSEHVARVADVAPYVPGRLADRELPCLRAVLALGPRLSLLVVDGYATLAPSGRPGLGAHAAAAFGIPVVGVAKTAFAGATHAVEVRRRRATRPLYVTSAGGLPIDEAATMVAEMAGSHRIPDPLSRVDRLARTRHQ
ncbi:endonuclease V [Lapillicoccus jejuensis]|uniref:Endonuclease V n=1 Tax=Lapillicoccus jejuensis TaxID=402171 RepID=A0A542E0E0_9MICO|nr:endonuclease V [Lapillicoccus jejuensis]TQJ08808.1 endonuclease V [Lapillicoccus jejuensis]